jgi:hypothetical protein
MAEPKEPFIGQSDRPEVKIDPEKPIGELRVRDLQLLLGIDLTKTTISEHRPKLIKPEKLEWKEHKPEKYEKHEWKEFKVEKAEFDIYISYDPSWPGPDPRSGGLAQLTELIGKLDKRIDELSNQIEALKKK